MIQMVDLFANYLLVKLWGILLSSTPSSRVDKALLDVARTFPLCRC